MTLNRVVLQAMEIRCATLAELPSVASRIIDFVGPEPAIVLLNGDLGAGKTTLAQALCAALGIQQAATSPTFSLVNEYPLDGGLIYHIDLYRLESIEEAVNIGIEEYLYSGNWCFIEWPDLIMPILEEPYYRIEISQGPDAARIFRILKFATDPTI